MRLACLSLCLVPLVSCSSPHPLEQTNLYKRREAAAVMGGDPELAREAIPQLLRAMRDVDQQVRWRAEFALGRIRTGGIPAIAAQLKGPERLAAIQVLGSFGPRARAAIPALREAASDPDAEVRTWAALSLRQIEAAPAAPPQFGGPLCLFLHWGLSSVPHRAGPGMEAERVMENEKISAADYEVYGSWFTASKFDADEWVRIAKAAGARLLVVTAKGRDGFCLWDSQMSEFTAVRASEAKRDLLQELAQACERGGLALGVSYSIVDGHQTAYAKDFPIYVDWMHRHVEELLKRIPAAAVWLDADGAPPGREWRSDDLVRMIHRLLPAAAVSDHVVHGAFGTSGGYSESPDPLKSADRVIEQLVDAVVKGGGLVLDVGPRADGTIPEAIQSRLKILGQWLRWNGEAVYGVGPSPTGGRVTAKGDRIYVFLDETTKDAGIPPPGLKNRILKARVLGTDDALPVKSAGGTEWIPAPDLLNEAFTVVALELDGPPVVK
jgi:alpha-L-fucosidase